jgi:hypothetical protein
MYPVFPLFSCYEKQTDGDEHGALVKGYGRGKAEVFGEKPVTLPLCLP